MTHFYLGTSSGIPVMYVGLLVCWFTTKRRSAGRRAGILGKSIHLLANGKLRRFTTVNVCHQPDFRCKKQNNEQQQKQTTTKAIDLFSVRSVTFHYVHVLILWFAFHDSNSHQTQFNRESTRAVHKTVWGNKNRIRTLYYECIQ